MWFGEHYRENTLYTISKLKSFSTDQIILEIDYICLKPICSNQVTLYFHGYSLKQTEKNVWKFPYYLLSAHNFTLIHPYEAELLIPNKSVFPNTNNSYT